LKYEAAEVEALGQGVVTEIVRAPLDALLPEPLRRLEAAGELACETCETCEFLRLPVRLPSAGRAREAAVLHGFRPRFESRWGHLPPAGTRVVEPKPHGYARWLVPVGARKGGKCARVGAPVGAPFCAGVWVKGHGPSHDPVGLCAA
jgi:hypothetical protein